MYSYVINVQYYVHNVNSMKKVYSGVSTYLFLYNRRCKYLDISRHRWCPPFPRSHVSWIEMLRQNTLTGKVYQILVCHNQIPSACYSRVPSLPVGYTRRPGQ